MEILVTYDVNTETVGGRRRLRRVAKVCEGFGQRVQLSVFECVVDSGNLARLIHAIEQEIDPSVDSLRIYRLKEPRAKYVTVLGRPLEFDQREPLVF